VSGSGLLGKLIVPAIVAPVVAFVVAGTAILIIYRIVGRLAPGPVNRGFRAGQIASSALLALSHGTNDAQKTMGVITLALISHGDVAAKGFHVPVWVVLSAASAIALGTFSAAGASSARWAPTAASSRWIPRRIRGPGGGRRRDPRRFERRLPAVHHACHLRRDHGRGGRQARVSVRWGLAGNIAAAWALTLRWRRSSAALPTRCPACSEAGRSARC